MTRLSVNINKFATLRNARGGNLPDVVKAARDCERFGAEGITVHPRPDERHIRFKDVLDLREVVTTEFNIEGFPNDAFMELVLRVKPAQCTLVPDATDVVTSNQGWDTIQNKTFLTGIANDLRKAGIRVSSYWTDVLPKKDLERKLHQAVLLARRTMKSPGRAWPQAPWERLGRWA